METGAYTTEYMEEIDAHAFKLNRLSRDCSFMLTLWLHMEEAPLEKFEEWLHSFFNVCDKMIETIGKVYYFERKLPASVLLMLMSRKLDIEALKEGWDDEVFTAERLKTKDQDVLGEIYGGKLLEKFRDIDWMEILDFSKEKRFNK